MYAIRSYYACPVGIDTGKLTKTRRAEVRSGLANGLAGLAARRFAWVEDNRILVDSMSDGKLAYVWVPNTS